MGKINYRLFTAIFFLILFFSGFLGYSLSYKGLILNNIYVSGINISGLTPEIAGKKMEGAFKVNPNEVVFKTSDNLEIETLDHLNVVRDFEWVSNQAYKIGRSGNFFSDIKDRISLIFTPKELLTPLSFKEADLEEILVDLENKIDIKPRWPKIIKEDNDYKLLEGENGLVLDRYGLIDEIRKKLSVPGKQIVEVKTQQVVTESKQERVVEILKIINDWGNNDLLIKYKEFNLTLNKDQVIPLLGLRDAFIDQDGFSALVNDLRSMVETEQKNAVFEFENGKVKEFKPEVVGVRIDIPKFEESLKNSIVDITSRTIDIPVILSYPEIRTEDVNNLGIKELIAVGKSSFGHSIPGRVFNVNLAANRVNGVIVPPGEEFSFNNSVGEISRQTGYQTAYVISEGKTVLGDGGGVCQVSTTMFRAAMNFGFPITERKAHAYRVGYYEQDSPPGIDATIFSPTTDFKFLNDTGHHILIQTKVDTKNLTMKIEIYGTHDGRKATISNPVITSQSPAPATVYVDDPTLPKGTKKQIDWAATGAKVNFDYKVERGGEILFERKFVSNYQPWRAVYLVGTGQ